MQTLCGSQSRPQSPQPSAWINPHPTLGQCIIYIWSHSGKSLAEILKCFLSCFPHVHKVDVMANVLRLAQLCPVVKTRRRKLWAKGYVIWASNHPYLLQSFLLQRDNTLIIMRLPTSGRVWSHLHTHWAADISCLGNNTPDSTTPPFDKKQTTADYTFLNIQELSCNSVSGGQVGQATWAPDVKRFTSIQKLKNDIVNEVMIALADQHQLFTIGCPMFATQTRSFTVVWLVSFPL